MSTHDPTTLNRQGADAGTQYRSVIYFHDTDQEHIARTIFDTMKPYYDAPIVTELSAIGVFYAAEEYHQNYFRNNSTQGYCRAVISPKLAKLRQLYAEKLA